MTPAALSNYYQLRAYCWKLAGNTYRDLLHDAYVAWYNKTGDNLFEQPNKLGAKVIRNLFQNEIQKGYFMWQGGMYPKVFMSVSDDIVEFDGKIMHTPDTKPTPHDYTFWNVDLVPKIEEEFGMVLDGYSQVEVAHKTQQSPQLVSYHILKNKKKLSLLMNPIAGSRVKIIKRLSKKQFDALEDRDEYKNTGEGNDTIDIYVKDFDAYQDHGRVEGILVKLTKD